MHNLLLLTYICSLSLTNSEIVAIEPPRIHPAPILQSGKNRPNRITNPDSGLFTNAGYCKVIECMIYKKTRVGNFFYFLLNQVD